MAATTILNFIYRSHLVYYCTYFTKFGKCITLELLHARMLKFLTKIKSKMSATAILDFC